MIGVFDSGIGGLSIWKAINQKLPNESIIYIADQAHSPYGEKNPEYIRERGLALTEFLVSNGVSLIVVACNTATVQIPIQFLREKFPQVPFVGVEPPVKLLSSKTQTNHVALFATRATCQSKRLHFLLEQFAPNLVVEIIPTPEWVSIVEYGLPEPMTYEYLSRYLDPLYNSSIDVIGLGCTHYPFLLSRLTKRYGSRFTFIDVSHAVADRVVSLLNQEESSKSDKSAHRFITTTASTLSLETTINDLLNVKQSVESIQI